MRKRVKRGVESGRKGHEVVQRDKQLRRKHAKTLELLFHRPVSGNIKWLDIEALLVALGAETVEREGSRLEVYLFGAVRVFHRPHPSPDTDKGAVTSIRKWLTENGVTP
jgi:hypothetical protein